MRREAAFSLIELLAAVLISAVLATFGFGAYRAGFRQVTKLVAPLTLRSSY